MTEVSLASPKPSPALTVVASTRDYEVAIDPARRYLRLTLLGIWDRATTEAFSGEVGVAIDRLRRGGVAFGTFRTLADASAASVMPQESVGVLSELALRHGPASERVAILLHNMIQKLQVKRAAPEGMMASFFDRDEALAWLLTD